MIFWARDLICISLTSQNRLEDVFVYQEFMLLWNKPRKIDHPLTVLRKIVADPGLNLPESLKGP